MELAFDNITIEKVLQDFLVPLTEDEYRTLETSVLEEGCKTPLTVWKRGEQLILVDGHNRYNICRKHGLSVNIEHKDFEDLEAVKQWMIINQLGRRNLTSDQYSYYRGLRYLQEKKNKGGYDKVISSGSGQSTSKLLATEFNVSESTIKRDAKFAEGVEQIGQSNPKLRMLILTGKSAVSKKDIQLVTSLPENTRFKNEADLYNKIYNFKNRKLGIIEEELTDKPDVKLTVEEVFPNMEDRLKRIKSLVISHMNNAIENRDKKAIDKLRKIIDELEHLMFED